MNEILKLKITLAGSSPPIWRRVLVPEWTTLSGLHLIIQSIFDWDGEHLHSFVQGKRRFEAAGAWSAEEWTEEDGVLLKTLLRRKGMRLDYTYDFGDNWEHRIIVEERLAIDPDTEYPACIGGRRAAPPDDFGGIWRYNTVARALGKEGVDPDEGIEIDPETLEWLGDDFDPARFDRAEMNSRLSSLASQALPEEEDSDDELGALWYDADVQPDPARWRDLDEMEQQIAVELHHRRDKPHELPESLPAHAAFHAIVERQLAMDDPPETKTTLERLTGEGLSRHDAIHAIASVVAGTMHDLMSGAPASNESMVGEMRLLTRRRWEEGLEEPASPTRRPKPKPQRKPRVRPGQKRKKKKKRRR